MPRVQGVEVGGECGKRENCHPKNEVSGIRDQVSGTRSVGRKLTAEEMKAATQNQVSVDSDQLSVTRWRGG